jgi:epoxyqueuosine reductase QueG
MEKTIEQLLSTYIEQYTSNPEIKTRWLEPLVGFASAQDPLFAQLKSVASPAHLLPRDVLKDAKTVIAYFIPFHQDIAKSNTAGDLCSKTWAIAYRETNQLIVDINTYLKRNLSQSKIKVAVLPPTHNFDQKSLVSDWSHKHIAYIAGLGDFGLHQMLITKKGCCGRLGSIVIDREISPTPRPGHPFCLYRANGSCTKCVDNCKWHALTATSYDRHACYDICLTNAAHYAYLGLADVCGKCMCMVPCSFRNPVRPDVHQ